MLTAAASGPSDAQRARIEMLPAPLPAILARALEVAERVREAICGRPFLMAMKGGRGEPMTASFGVASFPLHARTKEELVQRADRAMQTIKSTTKNGIATTERKREPDGA